jgi:hypothetical protein
LLLDARVPEQRVLVQAAADQRIELLHNHVHNHTPIDIEQCSTIKGPGADLGISKVHNALLVAGEHELLFTLRAREHSWPAFRSAQRQDGMQ